MRQRESSAIIVEDLEKDFLSVEGEMVLSSGLLIEEVVWTRATGSSWTKSPPPRPSISSSLMAEHVSSLRSCEKDTTGFSDPEAR